ncbi:microtubule-binding protein BIM1 KNAG_0L01050 [Huiozyma naganishii CBS 8797]|uniref:Calponin-homology (CH) domain-containing protein n=1 Tax=Huiozyma naganishii (strain ATCC MYA-139 / BCRC 22969 / CBS 8797 / KCTC 17520 / NBRC 10181 / NCYC 3082 / Yp74L-3) TaxID=1071383 RepID=J7SB43_HUIN7|nr:hypothetical protein KNAG_0L01050 [Kazachstania naganishii CBS 8797]CCK72726.1 hypothetical protein KNAG_0L01050 [Kazachstania naganishii CBS 8797]
MSGLGESRSELLAWVNDLLQLSVHKVEECGSGAVYCQIMDSIYLDVPMHRVKFDASAEYEYYTNYKILQSCFARHQIEKIVYVEKMVRCRFQDNLEFLQWVKRYWTQHKDGTPYDPVARRKYRSVSGGGGGVPVGSTGNSTSSLNVAKRKPTVAPGGTSSFAGTATRSSSNYNGPGFTRRISNEQVVALQTELAQSKNEVEILTRDMDQYRETTSILEREREFYFGKLRDIEILVQSTQDLINEGLYRNETAELNKFLNKVQTILYATEETLSSDDNLPISNTEDAAADTRFAGNNNLADPQDQKVLVNNNITDPSPSTNLIIDEETF